MRKAWGGAFTAGRAPWEPSQLRARRRAVNVETVLALPVKAAVRAAVKAAVASCLGPAELSSELCGAAAAVLLT